MSNTIMPYAFAPSGLAMPSTSGYTGNSVAITTSSFGGKDPVAVFKAAWGAWEAVCGVKGTLKPFQSADLSNVSNFDPIRVSMGTRDGLGGNLAAAFKIGFTGSAFRGLQGDIYLDKADFANTANSFSYLVAIVTHEIGHVLNLDHSTFTNSIMYPFVQNPLGTILATDVAVATSEFGSPQTEAAAMGQYGTVGAVYSAFRVAYFSDPSPDSIHYHSRHLNQFGELGGFYWAALATDLGNAYGDSTFNFIQGLFGRALGRAPSSNDIAAHTAQINAVGRGQSMQDICTSLEAANYRGATYWF